MLVRKLTLDEKILEIHMMNTPEDPREVPAIERVGMHAERGEESVAHMMRLYAGHDLLHIRQIGRIRAAVATAGEQAS